MGMMREQRKFFLKKKINKNERNFNGKSKSVWIKYLRGPKIDYFK